MIWLSNVRGFVRLRRAAGVIGLPPILSILPRRRHPSLRSRLNVCDGDEVDDDVDNNVGSTALLLRRGGGR